MAAVKACGATLRGLTMAELEAIASGSVECPECEVEMAQMLLAHWRECQEAYREADVRRRGEER